MQVVPRSIPVEIKIVDDALMEFGLPTPATSGAAAYDLVALSVFEKTADGKPNTKVPARPIEDGLTLAPWEIQYVGVGFAVNIMDPNYAVHILPRSSSTALGMALGNTVGLLDSDYQGPLIVALHNRNLPTEDVGAGLIHIERGERIAQMYLAPVVRASWTVVKEFGRGTARADGCFGSTGRAWTLPSLEAAS